MWNLFCRHTCLTGDDLGSSWDIDSDAFLVAHDT